MTNSTTQPEPPQAPHSWPADVSLLLDLTIERLEEPTLPKLRRRWFEIQKRQLEQLVPAFSARKAG